MFCDVYYLGVLLYGPPGCGKTSLVRSIASSANLNVLTAMAAELYSPYLGVTEANISQLFQRARANVPAVLFIDEIGKQNYFNVFITFFFLVLKIKIIIVISFIRFIS